MTAKTEPGIVIAFRNDRLGARLNTLLTAMRISKTYGATLKVFWMPTETDGLKYPEDLFSKEFMDTHFVSREESRDIMRKSFDLGVLRPNLTREKFVTSITNGTNYLSQAATKQVLLPWEDQDALDCLPELMKKIGLNPRVQEMVELINERLQGLSFSSYHLRRGDIISDNTRASHALWPTKYIPRVIYEWHMKRTLEQNDEMVVVFSDTKHEVEAFSALSPQVRSFEDLIGDADLTPLQRDFVELYTMSRSNRIFAPPNSAFSGMAAIIGNRVVTDITEDLSAEERNAAMDELVDRLENRPEMFISQSDLGQNFPFITDHLDARSEGKRATGIVLDHIRNGLNRAYAFSFVSRRLLVESDYEGCQQVLKRMEGTPDLHEDNWVSSLQHTAQAAMLEGDWEQANRYFYVGTWFSPLHRLTTENMRLLWSFEKINPEQYFPVDTDLMTKSGRNVNPDPVSERHVLMSQLIDMDRPYLNYPYNMDIRDWRRINGRYKLSRLGGVAHNRRKAEKVKNELERGRGPEAAWHGMLGVLWADAGELEFASKHLKTALNMQPEKPLYHKRMADLMIAEGRAEDAVPVMEHAWELSGRLPAYQAELAQCYNLARDRARQIELMLQLQDSDTLLLEVRHMVASAMFHDPDALERLPDYLNELLELTGGSHRVRGQQVKAYQRLQRWDEALAELQILNRLGRPSKRTTHKMMQDLFEAYRSAHNETQARKWFADNGVDIDELLSPHAD